ncbi:glycosyltransferase [Dasania sp. GY-MA-18]|uniref:Glycosyltransferase n=1 Tax=Dasania phycosphaerae TaxID=2950436 RepID=A0A9J6RJA4_9GAMM|nr:MULTISPECIES: glycosyltransferase [Dasania]MCR8922119.1 glycosyltransferase [Dasania sp. GY-MA-18]MCZ0864547.1 glycosyltransferase [Dasania phycosphaerae]MCZ0868275.1 glycosyltransferase [Dasania phycosphaerae]
MSNNKQSKVVLQILKSVDSSISSVAYSISSSVQNAGLKSHALLLRGEDESALKRKFDRVDSLDLDVEHWEGFRVKLFIKLLKYMRRARPDVVLVHRYKEFALLAIISKIIKGPKVVAVFHGERGFASWFRRLSCSLYMDESCYLVAVSGSVKRYLLSSIPGLHPSKVQVIHNGIDFKKIESSLLGREEARAAVGVKASDVVYGSIGRLVKAKGTDVLVKAFSEIATLNPKAVLVLMGDGAEKEKIEDLCRSLGVREQVKILGNVESASCYLKAFDFFVFPSLREGFGLALVEAMAAKVPVIFSDLDIFRALAIDHKYMVEANNVTDLAHKMEEVACDEELVRKAIVEKQYVYALEHFSIERAVFSYQKYLVENLL